MFFFYGTDLKFEVLRKGEKVFPEKHFTYAKHRIWWLTSAYA